MYNGLLARDVGMIFKNSVVRINNRPFYVTETDGDEFTLYGEYLDTGDMGKGVIYEEVSCKNLNTGYVNGRNTCLFIARFPYRLYKQGLHEYNIRPVINEGMEYVIPSLDRILRSKTICNTLNNNYPSKDEVLEVLNSQERPTVRAFDRQFAISKEGGLFYKGRSVGSCNMENGKFTFTGKFKYLRRIV